MTSMSGIWCRAAVHNAWPPIRKSPSPSTPTVLRPASAIASADADRDRRHADRCRRRRPCPCRRGRMRGPQVHRELRQTPVSVTSSWFVNASFSASASWSTLMRVSSRSRRLADFGMPAGRLAGAELVDEVGDHGVGRRRHEDVERRQRQIIRMRAIVQVLVHRDMHVLRVELLSPLMRSALSRSTQSNARMTSACLSMSRTFGRAADLLERRDRMARMIGRERRAVLQIGEDDGAEPLGERDARVPAFLRPVGLARAAGRLLRIAQQRGGARGRPWRRARRGRLHAREVGPFRRLLERRFLQAGVEADVDGRLRLGARRRCWRAPWLRPARRATTAGCPT